MGTTSVRDLIRLRIASQRLSGPSLDSPSDVVAALGAVQAQELGLALWSLGQRSDSTADEVRAALDSGAVLRTHVLRPTWHFVPAEDLRWMQRLTHDRIAAQARYYAGLVGADEELVGLSFAVFERVLGDGVHRTRAELGAALVEAGLEVPPRALPHLTLLAELADLITSGPLRDGRHTYALVAERVPVGRELVGDEALAELTRRYLAGHGPATVRDLAWWASLTQPQARRGVQLLGDEVETLHAEGTEYLVLADREPAPAPARAALLQPFDELVVGYSQSRWLVYADPEQSRNPNTLRYPLLVDGRVLGWWTARAEPSTPISVLVTSARARAAGPAVERAAAEYAAFAGRAPAVEWLDTGG